MTFEVDIHVETGQPRFELEELRRAALATLAHQGVGDCALSLLLTDDQRLRDLNRQFRADDSPTDVLSFPSGETRSKLPGVPLYLGDIAISVPYAARQAANAHHQLLHELQLLAVHGTLHLLGHDHGGPVEKALMWNAQQEVLLQLGLFDIVPTES